LTVSDNTETAGHGRRNVAAGILFQAEHVRASRI
jgi:hypothetical protein